MSILSIPQASTTPQADPEAINFIRSRTAFGCLKAVIGSQHAFRMRVKEKIPVITKDGKSKDLEVDKDVTFHRTVRSLHHYAAIPKKWMCLSCSISSETEDDLVSAHHAVHGGPAAMAKAGLRHVYCAETLGEVDVHDSEGGRPVIRRESALLSDRDPA